MHVLSSYQANTETWGVKTSKEKSSKLGRRNGVGKGLETEKYKVFRRERPFLLW